MTIAKTGSSASYAGDGVTVAFSFPFRFFDDTDLSVYLVDSDGTATLQTLTTDYTVSNTGTESGGTVTMVVAPSSAFQLLIERDIPETQSVDYQNNDAFPAETHETALDRLTLITQQNTRNTGARNLSFPVGDESDPVLPAPSFRSAKIFGFDASGSILMVDTSTSIFTTFATRDLFIANLPSAPDGAIVSAGSFSYQAKSGATDISDAAGWVPFGLAHPNHFGAVGDGSDETARLNNWLDYDGILIADGSKTYTFTSQITPANNCRLIGNLNLILSASIAGNVAAFLPGSGCVMENVNIQVATGVTIDRVFVATGDNCKFGEIRVTSVDQQNNRSDTLDGSVYLSGDNVQVGRVFTENFDNGSVVYSLNGAKINDVEHKSYVRGMLVREASNVRLGQYFSHVTSPNASGSAGHNGFLMEQTSDFVSGPMYIRDAGEHGWRIGGNEGETGCQNIYVSMISSVNVGQCGLKINDSSQLTRNVKVGSLFVVDAAQDGSPGSNEDGLRIEKAKDVTFDSVHISRQNASKSCYDGVYLAGVERVHLPDVRVESAANHSVEMVDTVGGITGVPTLPLSNIYIGNLISQGATNDVINISSTTENLSHIIVSSGYARDSSSGSVVDITTNDGAGGGGVPDPLEFTMTYHNVGAGITTASTSGRIYDNLTLRN